MKTVNNIHSTFVKLMQSLPTGKDIVTWMSNKICGDYSFEGVIERNDKETNQLAYNRDTEW